MTVKRHLAFQAQRIAGTQATWHDAELPARFRHLIPHTFAGGHVRGNINLKAIFGSVAGSRNHGIGKAANCSVLEPVIFDLGEVNVGKFLERGFSFWALDGNLSVIIAHIISMSAEP